MKEIRESIALGMSAESRLSNLTEPKSQICITKLLWFPMSTVEMQFYPNDIILPHPGHGKMQFWCAGFGARNWTKMNLWKFCQTKTCLIDEKI